ncbi:hypothetical protein [Burkholderia gladioli]|nr:hypothetical protein [Burkholderia gladioli]
MKKSEAEDAWLRKMPVEKKIKAGIVVQALERHRAHLAGVK